MDLRTTLFSERITERGRFRKRLPDVLAGLLLLLFLLLLLLPEVELLFVLLC